MKKTMPVAIGIIINANQDILVSRRHPHVEHGDQWEFPGGKVEQNENFYAALCRELHEELGITVVSATQLMHYQHEYEKYICALDIWRVDQYDGEASGCEGQEVRWVSSDAIQKLPILDGSQPIIDAIHKVLARL
jgi:8-oxo-dGTP diphosphatase